MVEQQQQQQRQQQRQQRQQQQQQRKQQQQQRQQQQKWVERKEVSGEEINDYPEQDEFFSECLMIALQLKKLLVPEDGKIQMSQRPAIPERSEKN
eukprot:758407-Hanusia_phi.AAC.3